MDVVARSTRAALQFLALLKRLFPTNPWKIAAFAFALLNLKNLPFVWHLRLLHSLYQTIPAAKRRIAQSPGPSTLFLPIITSSRTPPYECDYNLHKNNSTYFSDFDVSRLDLLVTLIGTGLNITKRELAEQEKRGEIEGGVFRTALGGVAVNFKREIKPFQKFEVWSRILAWDRKWLYVIGHFVLPGTARPQEYVLQPGRKPRSGGRSSKQGTKPVIFASAIAKYCVKKGRLTIPTERILRASQLLPPKPASHDTPPTTDTPDDNGTAPASGDGVDVVPAATNAVEKLVTQNQTQGENATELLEASLVPENSGDKAQGEWDWDRVEKERARGMKVAELYGKLEALEGEFVGDGGDVLGEY